MTSQFTQNNFEMDEATKSLFNNRIDALLDVSPSDAGALSEFTKTGGGYRGVMEIISSQGRFVVESAAKDLENLINSLFHLMHRRMRSWQTGRFQ
jgi:hypothetical protein